MSHFIEKCSCGVVLAQCRCPDPNKHVRISDKPCTHSSDSDSTPHSSEPEESTTFKDVLYQVWRNGRDNLDRYETVEIALEAHKKVIARERQKAVEDTVVKIMSTETEGLFDNGDLFIKQAPIEQVIINLIGFEKFKAIQDAVSAAQSKESK